INNAEVTNEPVALSFAEKMMVKKAMKKADKILKENDIKDINNLEDANKVQQRGGLITGIVLILAGILLGVLLAPSGLGIIGAIVAAIGVVLLVIGLLNRV
nr:hypothetical protein [Bacteroidota bacterium]